MKNIIIITANPKTTGGSVSLQMAEYAYKQLSKKYSQAQINVQNLYDNPIKDINANILNANIGEEEQAIFSQRQEYLEDFLNADLVVLSMPMWNWNYPAQFKLYMDTLWVARKTFAYNQNGDIYGLVPGGSKKVLLIASMGGLNHFKGNDHGYAYLKDSLTAIGLNNNDIKYIPVQGTAFIPQDGHSQAIGAQKALEQGKILLDFTLTTIK